MNEYEAKQAARANRYEALAEKAEQRGGAAMRRFDSIAGAIPMGQPILVGHHSERRHRADLARSDAALRRASEESDKAEYYRGKAAAVGRAGISSDDPAAVAKLREKLVGLEAAQETMKKANKIVRRGQSAEAEAAIAELGIQAPAALFAPDCCGRRGFPDYALQNNNANIRRVRERINTMEAASAEPDSIEREYGDILYREEDNRVQLVFPGKPSADVRAILKRQGFRWSRTNGAWQRHRNESGRYAARSVLAAIGAATPTDGSV